MAQLALGAVGAVVGGLIGGPVGASIGWSLGAAVGGALFAPKTNQYGPRLTEYRMTESSYGSPLPQIYGGARLGAQVIWAGEVYERENKRKVSKRGYVTEYRYEQSFAVAVCAGPIQAIRKVWFDNKLVYSSEITDVATALETGTFLERSEWWFGSETQAVSGIIQAEAGIDLTPAYRGVAGICFHLLDLTQWGNRIPSINAEVLEYGTYSVPNRISSIGYGVQSSEYDREDPNVIVQTQWAKNFPVSAIVDKPLWTGYRRDATTGALLHQMQHHENYLIFVDPQYGSFIIQNHKYSTGPNVGEVKPNSEQYFYDVHLGLPYTFPVVNMPNVAYAVLTGYVGGLRARPGYPQGTYVGVGGWLVRPTNDMDVAGNAAFFYPVIWDLSIASHWAAAGMYAKWDEDRQGGTIYFFHSDDSTQPPKLSAVRFSFVDGDLSGILAFAGYPYQVDPVTGEPVKMPFTAPYLSGGLSELVDMADLGAVGGSGAGWIGMDEADGQIYYYWSNSDSKIHMLGYSPVTDGWELGPYDQAWPGAFYIWDHQLVYAYNFAIVGVTYEMVQVRLNSDFTTTELGRKTDAVTNPAGGGAYTYFIPLGHGVYLTEAEEWTMSPALDTAGRTLDEVITMICEPVLEAEDLDVTAVDDILVRGYWCDRRTTRRSAVEPLLPAYGVDALESDGKLAFRPRGTAAIATVLYADTGVADDAMDADGAPEEMTRERTPVLPQRVDVLYANVDAAYQIGNQIARRGQELSDEEATLQFPIAMTDAEAAQCAARTLTAAWAQRTRREWSTTLKYAHLEPGDVIYAERRDGRAVRERIVSKREDDGKLFWESVEDDAGVYVQVSSGAPSLDPPTLPPLAPSTYPIVFEVPPLSDIDALGAVLYAAAWSYSATGWSGAVVFVSDLSDGDFTQAGEITGLSLGGSVISPLPAWTVESPAAHLPSSFTASIPLQAPDEYTADEVLAGAGLAYVGGELIRYQNATSLGDSLYRFDGIIRGEYGTDYAAGQHATGEPVLLIPDTEAVLAITRQTGEISTTSRWRAVSTGKNPTSAPYVSHTFNGRTLRPIAPAHVRIGRLSNGDRLVTWTMRNRAQQNSWLQGIDVPSSDWPESYRVQVISSAGTVLRDNTVSEATSWTYPIAQWQADFGAQPTTVRIRVAQISSLVGAGEWRDVTIPWATDWSVLYDWDALLLGPDAAALPRVTAFNPGGYTHEQDGSGGSYAALIYNGYTNDIKLRLDDVPAFLNGEIRFRTASGDNGRYGGVCARTTNWWAGGTGGYGLVVYLANYSPVILVLASGTNTDSSTLTTIASANTSLARWAQAEIVWELVGNRHRIWVDGSLLINTTSSTYASTAGQCGIAGKYYNPTGVDGLQVRY